MIYATTGQTLEATTVPGVFLTGLVGTIGFRIRDDQGGDALARTTAGVAEDIATSTIYRKQFVAPATVGQYLIVWDDGSGHYATEDLTVTYQPVTPQGSGTNYITVDALKATLNLTGQTFADADALAAITAASRAIDEQTGRRFYPDADAAQVRKFWPVNPGYCLIDDLCQFTTLTVQADTWTLETDFYFEPMNAPADGRPWTAIRTIARPFIYTLADRAPGWAGNDGRIAITGKWGWLTTPAEITEACGILAGRLLRRAREAPFGVIGTAMTGDIVRLSRLDPDVQALIGPYTLSVIA